MLYSTSIEVCKLFIVYLVLKVWMLKLEASYVHGQILHDTTRHTGIRAIKHDLKHLKPHIYSFFIKERELHVVLYVRVQEYNNYI